MTIEETPNLQLPYIMAAQAQKHVTHNEAIRALDAVVQLSVKDRDLTAPPAAPFDGDRYIVGVSATGEWFGKDGQISAWQDNAWMFYEPLEGWLAWVDDEDNLLAWDGSGWDEVLGAASVNPAPLIGVNATASDPDKLTVKSDAVLFSHDDVTPGTGDIQTKLNKAAALNTATFLFQNNWSGRAEIGLSGDDDFHFKVSPNGSSWFEGLVIDKDTGKVSFPSGGVREVLQANRIYYIATSGNDATNDGLSAGAPLATIQKGVDEALKIDANGFTVTVSIADGNYSDGVVMTDSVVGTDKLIFQGNLSTPGNVEIDTTGHCFFFKSGARAGIAGFKLQASNSGADCIKGEFGVFLEIGEMEYGVTGNVHIELDLGSFAELTKDYAISGGASRHIVASKNSTVFSSSVTATLSGTPNFSQFVISQTCGCLHLWSPTYIGAATGQRYRAKTNGAINTSGMPVDFLPGDTAGTTENGGIYA